MKNTFVIHIIHFSSRPGGIEVLIPRIIKGLKKYSFRIFVFRPPSETNIYESSNFSVCYGHNDNFKAYLIFIKYVRKYRKDIFHVYNGGPFVLLILRLFSKGKVIYSIHGTKYWQNYKQETIRKWFWSLAISKKMFFTSNSDYSKNVFLHKISTKPDIQTLYNPISHINFSQKERPCGIEGPLRIIYAGRLSSGKNLDNWINIALMLGKLYPGKFLFELYGYGKLHDALENKIKENKAENYIFLMGYSKNATKIYQRADLLLFLSEYESFGNVVVESILCGTPVIASNIPSMREIFCNYPDFLIELDDNLKLNVIKKLENINKLKLLVPAARKEFVNRFSERQHLNKLADIYSSISAM
jgi:glycosyltransferase involved in cell wall biosynthesis